jgi:hypothetical protein
MTATTVRLVSRAKNLARLGSLPQLERLWCFDLNAKTLPIVGALGGLRRLYIDGVRATSLDALRSLGNLEVMSLEACTQVDTLQDLAPFRGVRGLCIKHFPKVHALDLLQGFSSLSGLVVAGGMWSTMTVKSLSPLGALTGLRYLSLANLKASDESLEPLASLHELLNLELPNFYPFEEFARLSTVLKNTNCSWFASSVAMSSVQCKGCGRASMVMLTGKGKPLLCTFCDEVRVGRHGEAFAKIAGR